MLTFRDDRVVIVNEGEKINVKLHYNAFIVIALGQDVNTFRITKNRFGPTGIVDDMFFLKQLCFGTFPIKGLLSTLY